MRHARGGRLLAGWAYPAAILAASSATAASAQQAEDPAPPPPDAQADEDGSEVVVIGTRGSAVADVAPLATFDAGAIAAVGAATMGELLQAIRGVTESASGTEPIYLLNAQRVSGFQEIGSLPPEAIEKVEVLPEQTALRFGFPPTRRVVNFITKTRFRQAEVRASAGTTTRWGSATQKANLGMTRLREGGRLTLGGEYRRTDALFHSDGDIMPDPDIPFDALGNITGVGGGEIDPALSAAAGQAVRIAPVPGVAADRGTLAGFAAGANAPRLFELGSLRTLTPHTDAVKAEGVIANRIGETLAGSLGLSAEHSRDRSVGGPAAVRLIVPGGNPHSPFGRAVILNRYLTETGALDLRQTNTVFNAGLTVRGAIAGWRWDFTGTLNQRQIDGENERGVDPAAANAAIAAGADPFAPLDASLLTARITNRTRQRTRAAGAKTVVTNAPVRLPAGPLTVIGTVEADRLTATSFSRGPTPFDLELGRTRIESGLALDMPLASRREGVLPFMGELSVNASANAREVSGFGALRDTSLGVSWAPIEGVQLLATVRRSAAAPDMALQSAPVTRIENAPVFDYVNGRTEVVTMMLGGNPDLLAERRLVRSLALTVKPFPKREVRLAATYEATTIRDQVAVVQAITPLTAAILPDLFTRDASGRLLSVSYRPINLALERQRTLNLTLNANGRVGRTPPPGPPGTNPPPQPAYHGGIGPSIKFEDRLQIRPGGPELDLLAGDTIRGWGMSNVSGYAFGGINYLASGLTFNGWYQNANRVRSDNPAGDLRFSSILRLNINGYVGLGSLLKQERWASKLRLGLEVSNVTDARQSVRDRNGRTPNRSQPHFLDPIGRTVTLTLRKLF